MKEGNGNVHLYIMLGLCQCMFYTQCVASLCVCCLCDQNVYTQNSASVCVHVHCCAEADGWLFAFLAIIYGP